MLGAAGVYAYSVSGNSGNKPIVTAANLPQPVAPAPVAAQTTAACAPSTGCDEHA